VKRRSGRNRMAIVNVVVRREYRRALGALLVALALQACTSSEPSHATSAEGSAAASSGPTMSSTVSISPSPLTSADAERCPVTPPGHTGPPGARQALFGWGAAYGNGKLWVGGLWPHGVIEAGPGFVDRHGRVGMKFGWWREVPGRLRITGQRLDASAPRLLVDVPTGYGATGFQSSGVTFPTEGCWEVMGEVGQTTLSFVTFVIKKGTG
jgi:hypothetical protein